MYRTESPLGRGLLYIALLACLGAGADTDDPAAVQSRHRADAALAGAAIYSRSCAVCHGDRGAGAAWGRQSLHPAPRDFTTPTARAELTRERMIASVAAGRPGTAMAAWGGRLDTDEIEAVVDHIRTTLMRPERADGVAADTARPRPAGSPPRTPIRGTPNASAAAAAAHAPTHPTAVDMTLGMPDGLIGDAQSGKRFYEGNCAECHGLTGDGEGPRAYFIFPRPRNFLHPATRAAFNRPNLFRATKHGVIGREMPAWGKVLDDQRIADVSEYVFRTFVLADEETPRTADGSARSGRR